MELVMHTMRASLFDSPCDLHSTTKPSDLNGKAPGTEADEERSLSDGCLCLLRGHLRAGKRFGYCGGNRRKDRQEV